MTNPLVAPAMPPSGWWKSPSTLGTDVVFLRVSSEHRLAAVGLYTSSVGWALTHDSSDGWIPAEAIYFGQVCSAPESLLRTVADQLVTAGVFRAEARGGLDGYIVAGAVKAIDERFARKESASAAGKKSQQSRLPNAEAQVRVDKYGNRRIDPNMPVDWSQVSGEL